MVNIPNDRIICNEKVTPSNVQLFRYSAVLWNSHRIHYDRDYAITEGYPDIIVPANLHAAIFIKFIQDWAGERGRIVKIAYKNLYRVLVNETTNYMICVQSQTSTVLGTLLQCELKEINGDGKLCLEGSAEILIGHNQL